MKKKKAATNWRKRHDECLAALQSTHVEYQMKLREYRGQIEVGDALLDKQRERLIRLTEIKTLAGNLVGVIGGAWSGTETFELDGTKWILDKDAARVSICAHHVLIAIAALEVDSFVPQKGKP